MDLRQRLQQRDSGSTSTSYQWQLCFGDSACHVVSMFTGYGGHTHREGAIGGRSNSWHAVVTAAVRGAQDQPRPLRRT
jgi:hypothetical protein